MEVAYLLDASSFYGKYEEPLMKKLSTLSDKDFEELFFALDTKFLFPYSPINKKIRRILYLLNKITLPRAIKDFLNKAFLCEDKIIVITENYYEIVKYILQNNNIAVEKLEFYNDHFLSKENDNIHNLYIEDLCDKCSFCVSKFILYLKRQGVYTILFEGERFSLCAMRLANIIIGDKKLRKICQNNNITFFDMNEANLSFIPQLISRNMMFPAFEHAEF